MKLTVKELAYLFGDSGEGWEKYKIKNKLRDVANSLAMISESERVDEFTAELIPIIYAAIKIAFRIDVEFVNKEIKKNGIV